MRNFEERMDEIQKRSHARIVRRRKQMTALCVPLVAALCVGGALLIPKQTPYHNDMTIPAGTTIMQYCGSVTVVNGNLTVSYSNRDTVEAVRHLVSSLPPMEDSAIETAQKYNHIMTTQATHRATNYTIILETEDGTTRYKLLGSILTNQDTDELYALSDTQRVALLEILSVN